MKHIISRVNSLIGLNFWLIDWLIIRCSSKALLESWLIDWLKEEEMSLLIRLEQRLLVQNLVEELTLKIVDTVVLPVFCIPRALVSMIVDLSGSMKDLDSVLYLCWDRITAEDWRYPYRCCFWSGHILRSHRWYDPRWRFVWSTCERKILVNSW